MTPLSWILDKEYNLQFQLSPKLLPSLKAIAGFPFHQNELWYLLTVSRIHGNIDLFDVSSALYFLSHQIGDSRLCHFLHTLYRPTYGKTSVSILNNNRNIITAYLFNVVFTTKHGLACLAPVGILFQQVPIFCYNLLL